MTIRMQTKLQVLLTQLGISKMLKKLYFNLLIYLAKVTDFSRLFNIHQMGRPNSHVIFSPKKNFMELQLHLTLIHFSEFWYKPRSQHSQQVCPRFSKKTFGFDFICGLVFFQKYAMTSVQKNPKNCVNIHYFTNRRPTFLCYYINLLA